MELHTKIRLRRWRNNALFTVSILGVTALIYGFFFVVATTIVHDLNLNLTLAECHYIASGGFVMLFGGMHLFYRWKHRHDEPIENEIDAFYRQGVAAYQNNEPKENHPFKGGEEPNVEAMFWTDGWEDAEILDGNEHEAVSVTDLDYVVLTQIPAPEEGWTLDALDCIDCFLIAPSGWRVFVGRRHFRSSHWNQDDKILEYLPDAN